MKKLLRSLLVVLVLAPIAADADAGMWLRIVAYLRATGGGSAPATPANVQIILQGQDAQDTSHAADPTQPDHVTIGWSSTGAPSYNVYRSKNQGAYTFLANVSAASAATAYGSYVSGSGSIPYQTGVDSAYQDTTATNAVGYPKGAPLNVTGSLTSGSDLLTVTAVTTGTVTVGQGVDGAGIPRGTKIASNGTGSGGVGTYHLSANATANETGQAYGTVYFPNTGYTYKVAAVVGGVESALSSDSILIYFADGLQIANAGIFGGTLDFADTTSCGTSPLGFTTSAKWTITATDTNTNPYSGYSAVDQNIGIAGFNYFVVSVRPTQSGSFFYMTPEISGDQNILTSPLTSTPYASMTSGVWTTLAVPLTDLWIDQIGGANALQDAFYKVTFASDVAADENYCMEAYFSVNAP